MMTQDFRLTFGTHLGNALELRIPRANPSVTTQQVIDAMDQIIASDAFLSTQGRPVSRKAARIVTSSSNTFNLTHE